jgi:DNA-binding GntR family transcriptional regulator
VAQAEQTLPEDLFLDIDRSGPIPLYYQVASSLERAITDGTLPPGSRLENEVALGERLGLSRPTIRRAIQELVDKGLLVRRRGVGTQVVHGRVTRNVEFTSLFEDLERSGQSPQTQLLSAEKRVADEAAAEILGVEVGSPTLFLRRLRLADGVPLALLENTLPEPFANIDADSLTRHGLYKILRSRGVNMRVAKQTIGARQATAEEARLLDMPERSAVLTMNRTAFDNSGRAVEFGRHCYRPDLYSFEITLVDR